GILWFTDVGPRIFKRTRATFVGRKKLQFILWETRIIVGRILPVRSMLQTGTRASRIQPRTAAAQHTLAHRKHRGTECHTHTGASTHNRSIAVAGVRARIVESRCHHVRSNGSSTG
ncbi:unnamed protein product, partial [Pylaiella littoralis]